MELLEIAQNKRKFLRIGDYIIRFYSSKRPTSVWIEHKSGEGMETSVSDLVEALEESLEIFFAENM